MVLVHALKSYQKERSQGFYVKLFLTIRVKWQIQKMIYIVNLNTLDMFYIFTQDVQTMFKWIQIDPFASEELKQELKKRGHDLRDWPGFGSTQAIALEKDGFVAVAEPRLKERMQ